MRETKYRAWHKQEKKIYEVSSIHFGVQHGMSSKDRANLVELQGKSKAYIEGKDVELIQFTGVRTYKDVEIYEGDIIEFQLYEPGKRYRREVAFIEGCFMADMTTRLSTAMYVKVIGNIYEHSGLLS